SPRTSLNNLAISRSNRAISRYDRAINLHSQDIPRTSHNQANSGRTHQLPNRVVSLDQCLKFQQEFRRGMTVLRIPRQEHRELSYRTSSTVSRDVHNFGNPTIRGGKPFRATGMSAISAASIVIIDKKGRPQFSHS
ncbi:MAG: hypothetical protein K2Z81_09530, partial [Cyanobacteria bacterium]|nr:hypothetical protein [Cyanobacteriota bacterium]